MNQASGNIQTELESWNNDTKTGLSIYYVHDLQQAQGASADSEITPEEKVAHLSSNHQQQQAHSWFYSLCSVSLGMVYTDPVSWGCQRKQSWHK